MAKLSALQHLAMGFETTYGTPVASPTFFVPVKSVKPADDIKKIADEGRRASLAKTFNIYDGVTSSKVDIETECYADAVGYFLKGILGAPTTTGTNPNFTHTFKLQNAMAPSLTLSYNNAMLQHSHAGSIMSDLGLKFDTEGVVGLSAKLLGQKSTTVTALTPTFSTATPFLGWTSALKIGGTANVNLVGGSIDFKRDSKLLYGANNSQVNNKFVTGRVEAKIKLTFDCEDEGELSLLGGVDKSIQLTFTQNANTSLDLLFTLCDIDKATVDTSQEFVRCDLELTAIYNTTDAGICTITLKNQVTSY